MKLGNNHKGKIKEIDDKNVVEKSIKLALTWIFTAWNLFCYVLISKLHSLLIDLGMCSVLPSNVILVKIIL